MEKNWFALVIIFLSSIAFIGFLIKKNRKDRKNLFKKKAGDYPEPPVVKSEFDV